MQQFLTKFIVTLGLLAFYAISLTSISMAQAPSNRVELNPGDMPFSVLLPAGFPAPSQKSEEHEISYESRLDSTYCAVSVVDIEDLDKDEINANVEEYTTLFEDTFLESLEAQVEKKWSNQIQGRLNRIANFRFETDGYNFYAQSSTVFNHPKIYMLFCASMEQSRMQSSTIQDFFTSFRFKN